MAARGETGSRWIWWWPWLGVSSPENSLQVSATQFGQFNASAISRGLRIFNSARGLSSSSKEGMDYTCSHFSAFSPGIWSGHRSDLGDDTGVLSWWGFLEGWLSEWTSYQRCKIVGGASAGNAGNVFPATAAKRSRTASRHVRDPCTVMHAGLLNGSFLWNRWGRKRSRHSWHMRNLVYLERGPCWKLSPSNIFKVTRPHTIWQNNGIN